MESPCSCVYAGEVWLLKRIHLITLTFGERLAGVGDVVSVIQLKFHEYTSSQVLVL